MDALTEVLTGEIAGYSEELRPVNDALAALVLGRVARRAKRTEKLENGELRVELEEKIKAAEDETVAAEDEAAATLTQQRDRLVKVIGELRAQRKEHQDGLRAERERQAAMMPGKDCSVTSILDEELAKCRPKGVPIAAKKEL